ncbi:conserved hypothetical protein [Vibrio chagasii]|nr:conserved hypothetical protein [Vibrio chagasii]CAH7077712.1 conserved hypothetical protein [Vibrio chagasii]CAH7096009.1 conserved hypothetical protein [Vibrio chagasii]CAH7277659.1 conserved hypothetical protein [Vibrio chagasii]CAH7339110.1 conserved hypothetical protein [Vibrio chagasii]
MKWLAIGLLPFTLVGCLEGNKNTDQLCQSNPGLRCEQLNMNDGQCRVARTDLIWHRFEVQKQPTEINKIKEFELVTAYKKCLELAAQIETIDQSKLQERRFTSLMHSIEESERIVSELSQSDTPETLYFLWSQNGDTNARRSFLQLEGTEALNTAEMQYALATFYTTRDHVKTLKLLNNALTLSSNSNINTEIFKSMASINHSLGNMEEAYVWAMVAKDFNVPIASESELAVLYHFEKPKYKQLNKDADKIVEAIEDGVYSPAVVKSYE